MLLSEYVKWYAVRHDLAESSERQYLAHVRVLCAAVGMIDVADLTADMIGSHLRKMKIAGRSDSYRRGVRSHLVALLRAASEDKTLSRRPEYPQRCALPAVRIRDAYPKGFSWQEACSLLKAAGHMRGVYRTVGIPRKAWWQAWIPAAWDSGLAPCDLLALRRSSIAADGSYYSVRLKTGGRVYVKFQADTLAAMDAIGARSRELVFPRWGSYEALRKAFRSLCDRAGVRGSLKWLRSGSGSDVERQHPGAGHRHLGNSPGVFTQHYEVEAITSPCRPRPRKLEAG